MMAMLVFAIGFVITQGHLEGLTEQTHSRSTSCLVGHNPNVFRLVLRRMDSGQPQYYLHEVVGRHGRIWIARRAVDWQRAWISEFVPGTNIEIDGINSVIHQSLPSDETCIENPYRSPRAL